MDIAKLKEYLGILVELEKDKYSQETMIANLEENIVSYQEEYKENETIIDYWASNPKALISEKIDSKELKVKTSDKWVMILIVYVLCAFGGSIAWVLGRVITGSEILAIIIGVATVALICILGVSMWKSKLKKRKKQAIAQEQRQLRIKNDKLRVENDNGKKISNDCLEKNKNISSTIIPKLKKEKKALLETLELTEQTLFKCYEINIIPPKYRSLIPVCMFYDYIVNGRTYSITRDPANYDEGAINIYEQECLQRTIINKLDDVVNSIHSLEESIISAQRALCETIRESSRETNRLLEDINSNLTTTNESLQSIHYQNEQRNRCLEFMTYMEVHEFLN